MSKIVKIPLTEAAYYRKVFIDAAVRPEALNFLVDTQRTRFLSKRTEKLLRKAYGAPSFVFTEGRQRVWHLRRCNRRMVVIVGKEGVSVEYYNRCPYIVPFLKDLYNDLGLTW